MHALGHPQGELGQSSIFYSDDDATNSAFKAARQVGYSGNGFGNAASVSRSEGSVGR